MPPTSQKVFSISAEDIGHFQPMLIHRSGLKCARSLDDVEWIRAFQRADGRAHRGIGDVQIASGGLQLRMAEQDLNGAQVERSSVADISSPAYGTFLLLAVATLWQSARRNSGYWLFFIGLAGSALIFVGQFAFAWEWAAYGGITLLAIASLWNACGCSLPEVRSFEQWAHTTGRKGKAL